MKFLLLSASMAVLVSTGPAKQCKEREEFLKCGSQCESVCGKPSPESCSETCVENVCQCMEPYKRGPNGCVLAEDCPTVACEDPNAEYREEGEDPTCQMSCEDTKKKLQYKPCNAMLYESQCYCKKGFVPLKDWGKCVKPENCPK